MKIYNVMSQKKEEFLPIEQGKVKVYACGITVNGDAHLGHARQAVTFNVMTEYLRLLGYQVTYVRNYTDIDDKLVTQAKQMGIPPLELSARRIDKTDSTMACLLTRDADFKPRVSMFIAQIVEFVQDLIDKGFAYEVCGDVYFAVEKFSEYGKLSNRSTKDLLNNVRIEDNKNKQTPLDFALWKSVEPQEFGFDSPWGQGRPGWHIECSTMIKSILGNTVDIHGGGKDLIFPHHENEIAQSECCNNAQLARFWVHNGLITVDGQKMSKSMNNFITVEQLLSQYHPEVLRFLILQNHYSSSLEVNDSLLEIAERHMYSFYSQLATFKDLATQQEVEAFDIQNSSILKSFHKAMDNDFNISLFLSDLFAIFADINKLKGDQKKQGIVELLAVLKYVYPCVGLFSQNPSQFVEEFKQKYLKILNITEQEILDRIAQRKDAKQQRNFELADQIRNQLLSQGITLMDTPQATDWGIK